MAKDQQQDQNQNQTDNQGGGAASEAVKNAQIDLIKALGIDQLEPEKQEEALLKMNEVIQQRILIRVAEELSEEDQDQMEKMLSDEKTTPEQMQAFFQEKVPNLEKITLEEIGSYKKEMVGFMEKAMEEDESDSKDGEEDKDTDQEEE